MLILIDSKMPYAARQKLAEYGEVVEFATHGITYEAISGHPDIFFCPTPAGLIVAPNLPDKYVKILNQHGVSYNVGNEPVGNSYPASARYNTLVTEKFIIQNPAISDSEIRNLNPEHEIIPVKQGYVRCNLIALPNETFITSDRGIERTLKQRNLEVLFINPLGIKLDGFKNGFFGGTCGLINDKLFVCGSIEYFREAARIRALATYAGVSIVELSDEQPVDVGTILFLKG